MLTRQGLDRRIAERDTVSAEACAWARARNAKQTGVDWQFSTADARIKLKQPYPTVKE